MAENEGRAERIAELKKRNPRLTWDVIAQRVGVTERAAHAWRKTGAISAANAEKLADVFNVDFDYIWTGPRPETPEMFVDRRNDSSRLDARLERIEGALELAASERVKIEGLLAEQTKLLARIDAATRRADAAAARLDGSATRADESATRADQASREVLRRLEALQAAPAPAPEGPRTSTK